MRIGIMGGTLDPVHNGHISLAQAALNELGLDGVMLLPAGDPPHKRRTASGEQRMEMARLAARSVEGVFPCGIEVHRVGTTYTVDTLRELQAKNPSTEWFYIIGADTLMVLDSWKNFADVAKMCVFAVCGRAEEEISCARMEELQNNYGACFVKMKLSGPAISSTEIRRRVCRGEEICDLVPADVNAYIHAQGLYLSAFSCEEIVEKLRRNLKPARFAHTLGVAETAVRLAKRFGIAPAKAQLAALLHDCAKHMSIEDMRALLMQNALDVDAQEMDSENVVHAPAGAIVAREVYGVEDRAILSAIRRHTLGAADMSPLDALIYTADFIEPGRADFPGLSRARDLAETDIYAAMCLCAQLTNQYLEKQGRHAHPRSLAMLNHYQNIDLKNSHKEETK